MGKLFVYNGSFTEMQQPERWASRYDTLYTKHTGMTINSNKMKSPSIEGDNQYIYKS